MNKTISKNRFKTLAKSLAKNGIEIDYQIDSRASLQTTGGKGVRASFYASVDAGIY